MDRDEVVVRINAKITWPIFNHLDRTCLVNKGFISYDDNENFFCGTNVGNPILPARVARMFSGFAWSCLLRPSQGCFRNFSNGFILRVSFSFVITYPGNLVLTAIWSWILQCWCPYWIPLALSSSEIPTGCPNKNSKYKRKIECARGWGGEDDWEEGKGPLFSLFPSHRAPGCFPFLSFQPPCDTKRQISRGDTLYGARTFQYKPTSISSPHQTGIKLNFKRTRVEKSDFYLAENIQLILENKNDTSRLDFSHDYKYLKKQWTASYKIE